MSTEVLVIRCNRAQLEHILRALQDVEGEFDHMVLGKGAEVPVIKLAMAEPKIEVSTTTPISADITAEEAVWLKKLEEIPGWNKKPVQKLKLLRELVEKYPKTDPAKTIEDLRFKIVHGEMNVKSVPGTLRTFFRKADEWARERGNPVARHSITPTSVTSLPPFPASDERKFDVETGELL